MTNTDAYELGWSYKLLDWSKIQDIIKRERETCRMLTELATQSHIGNAVTREINKQRNEFIERIKREQNETKEN